MVASGGVVARGSGTILATDKGLASDLPPAKLVLRKAEWRARGLLPLFNATTTIITTIYTLAAGRHSLVASAPLAQLG